MLCGRIKGAKTQRKKSENKRAMINHGNIHMEKNKGNKKKNKGNDYK